MDSDLPRMETLERNSSYILRLRIVDPIRMRRYESRSNPHSLTSVLAAHIQSPGPNRETRKKAENILIKIWKVRCDWGPQSVWRIVHQ